MCSDRSESVFWPNRHETSYCWFNKYSNRSRPSRGENGLQSVGLGRFCSLILEKKCRFEIFPNQHWPSPSCSLTNCHRFWLVDSVFGPIMLTPTTSSLLAKDIGLQSSRLGRIRFPIFFIILVKAHRFILSIIVIQKAKPRTLIEATINDGIFEKKIIEHSMPYLRKYSTVKPCGHGVLLEPKSFTTLEISSPVNGTSSCSLWVWTKEIELQSRRLGRIRLPAFSVHRGL